MQQVANEREISADWEARLVDEIASRPKCGKKCGITLGVLGTVGVAFAVPHVRRLITPERE